jgi:hypothetical protein
MFLLFPRTFAVGLNILDTYLFTFVLFLQQFGKASTALKILQQIYSDYYNITPTYLIVLLLSAHI